MGKLSEEEEGKEEGEEEEGECMGKLSEEERRRCVFTLYQQPLFPLVCV